MVALLTGAGGFIGSNLFRYGGTSLWRYFDWRSGHQLLAPMHLHTAARGCSAVVHLAAISGIADCEADPERAEQVNVEGTARVCELGLPVIFASTAGAIHGDSVYAETKRQAEAEVLRAGGTVLRLANVYGPGMGEKRTLVANTIRAAREGTTLTVRGDGSQTRDFVHVDDVRRAFVQALTTQPRGIYTVATGQPRRCSDVVEIARRHGRPFDVIRGAMGDAEVYDGSVEHTPLPGWAADISLERGLRELINGCGE